MSLHNVEFEKVRCSKCSNLSIPFKKNFKCPFCGHSTDVYYDFVTKVVESMIYHKKKYGRFFPYVWSSANFAESVQSNIFRLFDSIEENKIKKTKGEINKFLDKGKYLSEDFKNHFKEIFFAVNNKYKLNSADESLDEKHVAEEDLNIPAIFRKKDKKTKVLHFEDDKILGELYKIKFIEAGFSEYKHYLNPPRTNKGLINLVIKEKPDLIVMDIIMPRMDGFEATKILKSNNVTKDIPIFGLCNMSQKEDIEKAIALGMTDYFICSRLTPSEIGTILKKFLNEPSQYKQRYPIFIKE